MRAPRGLRVRYKGPARYPHERRRGGEPPLAQDALSGAWVPECFLVEGPFGLVDGRNGGTFDLDTEEHEMAPDNAPPPDYCGP